MTIFAYISFAFGVIAAFTLYRSVNGQKLEGWYEYAMTVGIAAGSGSTVVTATAAIAKAWF